MLNDTAKNMQTIICQAIDSGNYYAAYEALIIYTQTFSVDDLVEEYKWLINEYGPQVSVICLDNNESAIDEFIKMQTYKNIELAKLSEEDSNADIIEYIKATSSKYICFWEVSCEYDNDKISEMVWKLESSKQFNVVMTPRMYVDAVGNIIGHKDYAYEDIFNNVIVKGETLLNYCVSNNINLYGSLSDIMLNKNCAYDMECQHIYKSAAINRLNMLFQILEGQKIFYMEQSLVRAKLSAKCDETDEINEYKELEASVNSKQSNAISALSEKSIKKEITFFYTDKGEYYNLEPIANEAG